MTTTDQAFDWKASTFSLSVQDVARVLGVSVEAVVNLMLDGRLGFWMMPDPQRGPGLPLSAARFDPQDVEAARESGPGSPEALSVAGVLDNLREFVRERGITRDYDEALRENKALRVRSGVHVRTRAVVAFAVDREGPMAARLDTVTREVFTRLGWYRARSLTPIGETKQRWHYWWRVPGALLGQDGDVLLGDLINPAGVLAPGESLLPSADGSAPVVDVPVTASEFDWGMPESDGG